MVGVVVIIVVVTEGVRRRGALGLLSTTGIL